MRGGKLLYDLRVLVVPLEFCWEELKQEGQLSHRGLKTESHTLFLIISEVIVVEIDLQELRPLISIKGIIRDQHLSNFITVEELVEEMNKVVFCLDVRGQRREPELPIEPWLVRHHKRRHDRCVSWLKVELIVSPGPCPLFNRVIVRPLNDQFWSPAPDSCHLPEQSVGISYMQGGSVPMSTLS